MAEYVNVEYDDGVVFNALYIVSFEYLTWIVAYRLFVNKLCASRKKGIGAKSI